jgi:hypothetical protein
VFSQIVFRIFLFTKNGAPHIVPHLGIPVLLVGIGMESWLRPPKCLDQRSRASSDWARKFILLASITVASLGFVALDRIHGKHPPSGYLSERILVDNPLAKIRKVLDDREYKNHTEFIDHLMGLVNRHTIHCIDDWHDRNWDKRDLVLSHLYRAMIGDASARPHSSCGPRCMIMAWILQSYGIPSRHIGVMTSKYSEYIVGHQQIEILNPDTGRWELYDPSWNVHFLNEKSGERVSALDLYFQPMKRDLDSEPVINGILPCNHNGSHKGWHGCYSWMSGILAPISNFAEYGAVIYYCYQTRHPNEILVNVNRFDLAHSWSYASLGLDHASLEVYCDKVYLNHRLYILDSLPPTPLQERLEHPTELPTY